MGKIYLTLRLPNLVVRFLQHILVAPQNLSGDSKSGSDLDAGTSKSWTLFIPNASANNIASRSMMSLNHSTSIERSDEVPIIWQE